MRTVCEKIGRRLEELARGRAEGLLTEPEFVDGVLQVEAVEVAPHGFALTASNTIDDWTVFKLRQIGCSEPCAAFEFLPQTGEFRSPGSGPR